MIIQASTNEKIYAAAVLDSGSSFAIKNGDRWSSVVRIRRSNSTVLDEMQRLFGGYISKGKSDYSLIFNGHQCTYFLTQVMPWMKVKTEQAKIILEFNARLKELGRKKPGIHISEKERIYREELNNRLKE